MKILHILDHSIPLHSGYSFRTRAILEHQRARGWRTAHITSAKHALGVAVNLQREGKDPDFGQQPLEEAVDGFNFYRTPRSESVFSRMPLLKELVIVRGLAERIAETVAAEQPDVLHAHSPALNGIAALSVGRKLGLPVVYETRAFWEDAAVDHGVCREGDLRYRLGRALETYVYRRASVITTICQGLKTEIAARGIAEERITIVPNAVDTQRFRAGSRGKSEFVQQFGLEDKTVLGFIGSFYAYEGLPSLLQALPAIHSRFPDVRVLLVGGGPQDRQLKQLAKVLGVADNVIFAGRVPHESVCHYYDLIDVLVYPRVSMRLTELVTPLKPLEAMAQGKLIAASSVGGHRELIKDGVSGYFFEPGNVEALSSKIIDLLEHRQQWPEIRRAARLFVEQERNWPQSVERYEPVYSRAINESV